MMSRKSLVISLVFFVCLLQVVDSQAQKNQKKFNINWSDPKTYRLDDETAVRCLAFEGAVYSGDFQTLPLFVTVIPVDKMYDSYDVSLSDVR